MKKFGNLDELEVQSYRYLTISQCKFLYRCSSFNKRQFRRPIFIPSENRWKEISNQLDKENLDNLSILYKTLKRIMNY